MSAAPAGGYDQRTMVDDDVALMGHARARADRVDRSRPARSDDGRPGFHDGDHPARPALRGDRFRKAIIRDE
jgi:hypothetical protein